MKRFYFGLLSVCLLAVGFVGLKSANWPTALSSDSNLYDVKNNAYTILNGAIDVSTGTITVNSTSGFPLTGHIVIEDEVIVYTSTTSTTFTGCTRGQDGTTAAAHGNKELVFHNVVAAHHNLLKDEHVAMSNFFLSTSSTYGYILHIDTTTPAVEISSSTNSSKWLRFGGVHSALPSSGYSQYTLIVLDSDYSLYISTAAVDDTGDWEKVGAQ